MSKDLSEEKFQEEKRNLNGRTWQGHVVQERVADHMTHKKRRKQNRKTP